MGYSHPSGGDRVATNWVQVTSLPGGSTWVPLCGRGRSRASAGPHPQGSTPRPVTYFRVICRRGVFPLAAGEAKGAEPSGSVENAAARGGGGGQYFPLPYPSPPLPRPPGPLGLLRRVAWNAAVAAAHFPGLWLEQRCGARAAGPLELWGPVD